MALMLSIEMAEPADALALLSERVANGRASLVLDHGVRCSPALIPGIAAVPKTAADDVALLDVAHEDGRWHTLMDLDPQTLAEDLRELAQALRIWLYGTKGLPEEETLRNHTGAIEKSLTVQDFLAWAYYAARSDRAGRALTEGGVEAWRLFLRRLGEGPASVFQDPWFGRLFLGGGVPFSFESKLTLVNLHAPRIPFAVTRRLAAIVAHRALVVHSRQSGSAPADLVFFVANGAAIMPTIKEIFMDFAETRGDSQRDLKVRLLAFDADKEENGDPELTSAIVQLSRLKHAKEGSLVDSEIYRSLPVRVDNYHRPDYIKGVMYNFGDFCQVGESDALPESLRVLSQEGITLGATAPLLDLPSEEVPEEAEEVPEE